MRVILASASPRRAELLRAAGFEFEVVATDVDERVLPGEPPTTYVRRLAAEKSAAALKLFAASAVRRRSSTAKQTSDGPANAGRHEDLSASEPAILAADTAVIIDGQILGKPGDDDEAADMIRRLSGRRHEVLTGISLRQGAFELGRVETTAVQFAAISEEDVAWYVASGEGRDKAGAYAIQGLASRFVTRIDGSYTNVVGLPIAAVVELLRNLAS